MATNVNGRSKMSREERAKQFMPFAALKGYEEALLKKEQEIEAKAALEDPSNHMANEQIETD